MNKNQEYTRREFRHRAAADYLKNLLPHLPPGERLPGIREMIAESGIGRSILEQELRRMADANIVTVRARDGWRRSHSLPNEQDFWFLLASDGLPGPAGFVEKVFDAIREYGENRDRKIRLVTCGGMVISKLESLIEANNIKNAFVFGMVEQPFASYLHAHLHCCVELLPRHALTLGPELRDSPLMTAMQVEFLLNHGYRKIGYIHQLEADWSLVPVQQHRLMEYYRIMAENGIKIEPEWVFFCGYRWEKFNTGMYQALNCHRLPEVFIVSGSAVEFVYRYCANNGISIGSELAVMGCDDLHPELSPRATTITNHPKEIAQQSWEIMEAAMRGKILTQYTNLRIVTGNSVLHKTTSL